MRNSDSLASNLALSYSGQNFACELLSGSLKAQLVNFPRKGPIQSRTFWQVLSEEIRRSEFSTDDRELGGPELTPLGERSGAIELEIVP